MSLHGVTRLLLLVLNNIGSPGARDSLVHSPYLILNSFQEGLYHWTMLKKRSDDSDRPKVVTSSYSSRVKVACKFP